MIMADSFVQSSKARDNEFTTGLGDTPLVVQFAANTVEDFVASAELVSPFSDGVDLNCGCPQRWAMQDGYGAHLLTQPQIIKDIERWQPKACSTTQLCSRKPYQRPRRSSRTG
uniref:DUS-like FMN-binding domain-containing protein n=1 Tax=Lygus hesperus TaxID=30085 RepID=A0A0K8SW78_LYGHE